MKQPIREPVPDLSPLAHPAVVAARGRHAALTAELADCRADREAAERDLGAGPKVSDEALEARLLARGLDATGVTRLRELRRRERVLAQAAELVAADVEQATDLAVRELTPVAREKMFLPAARAAVGVWLDAARKLEAFRHVVAGLQDRGVGRGTFSPFNLPVPVSAADPETLAAFAAELVRDEFATRDQITAAFPGLAF